MHKVALEQQHKTFLLVHKHLKQAKRRQAKYADKSSIDTPFSVGDPVYYKNFRKSNKLEQNWHPYFRIIEQKGPVSFVIKDQLSGRTVKAHADQIRLANIDDWEIPKDQQGRAIRKTTYVVPPDNSDSEGSEEHRSDMGDDFVHQNTNAPRSDKHIKRYRQERDLSSDEEDIPLMELSKRLQERKLRNDSLIIENDKGLNSSAGNMSSDDDQDSHSDSDRMSVNLVRNKRHNHRQKSSRGKLCTDNVPKNKGTNMKKLLIAVANLID
jgi:hypothetical protein